MLAYVNQEALALTQETGLAHYYSRSRDQLCRRRVIGTHSKNL